jgi:hypothetical protein
LVPDPDSGQGEASSEKVPEVILGGCFSAVESSCLVISGDDVIMGSVAGSDEAVSATPSGKVADSSPATSMLWRGCLRPVSSSAPEEEVVLALESAESSSTREVSFVSNEATTPKKDPDLDLVPGGGLSDEQRKDFNCVFLEMYPNLASCSQGSNPTFLWKMV